MIMTALARILRTSSRNIDAQLVGPLPALRRIIVLAFTRHQILLEGSGFRGQIMRNSTPQKFQAYPHPRMKKKEDVEGLTLRQEPDSSGMLLDESS